MLLKDKLSQEGFRLTRPRQVVLDILENSSIPLTPQTIHQRSVDASEDIGLVSVYRTLELLTELKLVHRVHEHGGCHGYVLSSPGHTHHVICQNCGSSVEFSGLSEISAFIAKIEKQTGYKIESHLLQLHGLCPTCLKG